MMDNAMKKRLLVFLTLLGLMFVLVGCSRLASEYEPGRLRDYRNSQEYGMAGADDSSSNEAAKNKQVFSPDHDRQNVERPMENHSGEPEGDETRYIEETVAPAETGPDMYALNAEEVTEEETAAEQTVPAAESTAAQAANTPGNPSGTPSGTPSGNTTPVSGGSGSGSTTPPNNSTTPTSGTEPSSEEPSSEETTTEPETTTLPAGDGIPIDESHFPDPAFRSYLMTLSGLEDGYLSDEDIAGINRLELDEMGITSLDGIGYFSDLTYLSASGNDISSLDLSGNPMIDHVICNNSGLSYLNVANTPIHHLWVQNNDLSYIDLSTNYELISLDVGFNYLDSLDVSNCSQLETLYCGDNNIGYLNVSNNPYLVLIICSDNYLTELDLSGNPQLGTLECQNNSITSLDLSSNPVLYWLKCENNQLSHIDLSNNQALADASLGGNPMTSCVIENSFNVADSFVHTSISPENFNIFDFDPYFDLSRVYDNPRPWDGITFDENGNISSTITEVSEITEMAYRYFHTTGSNFHMLVTIYFDR